MTIQISEPMKKPLPPENRGRPGALADRLRTLGVGECIEVSGVTQATASGSARHVARQTNRTFTTRKLPDNKIGLWRTA